MHDPSSARRSRGYEPRIVGSGDQGFLTEDVEIGPQRLFDERCMTARRRADVYEIERFAGQQIVYAFVPPSFGTRFEKRLAAGRKHIGRSDDPDIIARLPPGQVAFAATFPNPMNAPRSTRSPPQSSPNLREMAAND